MLNNFRQKVIKHLTNKLSKLNCEYQDYCSEIYANYIIMGSKFKTTFLYSVLKLKVVWLEMRCDLIYDLILKLKGNNHNE